MIKIKVSTFGNFKAYFGENAVLEMPETADLKKMLTDMADRYSDGRDLLFDKDGNIRRHLMIQVNKKRIAPSKAEEIILKDGDEIIIYPPVSGG